MFLGYKSRVYEKKDLYEDKYEDGSRKKVFS